MTKMSNPSFVRKITREREFNTKKRFGQNFLIDQNIINRILDGAQLQKGDWVLEIGPGLGALTSIMGQQADQVVAMEIDRDLVVILNDLLPDPSISIVEGDALSLDWEAVLKDAGWQGETLKLVANLPYYLTTPLIMKALEGDLPFEAVVVMVQREVAQRILAKPGTKDYGVLTLAVQYFTESSLVLQVPRTVFYPVPNVDSAVVLLKPRAPLVDAPREELFSVIRAAFQQRRKTVRNALRPLVQEWELDMEQLDNALHNAGLEPEIRGERLDLATFSRLTKELVRGV